MNTTSCLPLPRFLAGADGCLSHHICSANGRGDRLSTDGPMEEADGIISSTKMRGDS